MDSNIVVNYVGGNCVVSAIIFITLYYPNAACELWQTFELNSGIYYFDIFACIVIMTS